MARRADGCVARTQRIGSRTRAGPGDFLGGIALLRLVVLKPVAKLVDRPLVQPVPETGLPAIFKMIFRGSKRLTRIKTAFFQAFLINLRFRPAVNLSQSGGAHSLV